MSGKKLTDRLYTSWGGAGGVCMLLDVDLAWQAFARFIYAGDAVDDSCGLLPGSMMRHEG